MDKIIRFGIIGSGNIASQFAKGMETARGCELYAVAARNEDSAIAFANKFGAKKAYGSYEQLVQDDNVDVIYIATPNALHKEHSILAMKHKKNVICEKPLACNAKEAEEMIAVAKEEDVFLMEAMWTRFFPCIQKVKALVAAGTFGEIQMLQGDFGYQGKQLADIRYNLSLAGGALMDVGIYPVSFASFIYETQPSSIKALAKIGETGVDEQNTVIFQYESGALATLSSAMITHTKRDMILMGEKGYLHIPNVWQARSYTLHLHGKEPQVLDLPFEGNGYNYEIEEVVSCLLQGKKESDVMPLKESLAIMKTMDQIRKEIGLVFQADKE